MQMKAILWNQDIKGDFSMTHTYSLSPPPVPPHTFLKYLMQYISRMNRKQRISQFIKPHPSLLSSYTWPSVSHRLALCGHCLCVPAFYFHLEFVAGLWWPLIILYSCKSSWLSYELINLDSPSYTSDLLLSPHHSLQSLWWMLTGTSPWSRYRPDWTRPPSTPCVPCVCQSG